MESIKKHISTSYIIEEIFNSITHGIGVIASIVALVLGVIYIPSNAPFRIGFITYVSCLIILMLASTLYHSLIFTGARRVFQTIDHGGIFLLIAGTFTPFILCLYLGWEMVLFLATIWTIAVTGIAVTASILLPKKIIWAELVIYVCFGWMGLLLLPKIGQVSPNVIWLLVFGGVIYTLGMIPFLLKKPFAHFSWHLFILGAAAAHFFAIINLV